MTEETLQMTIENALFEYWDELPEPKPTYTKWFYSDRGPADSIRAMLAKMKRELEKTTYVPGCPLHFSKRQRPYGVCDTCDNRERCKPYEKTRKEIERRVA